MEWTIPTHKDFGFVHPDKNKLHLWYQDEQQIGRGEGEGGGNHELFKVPDLNIDNSIHTDTPMDTSGKNATISVLFDRKQKYFIAFGVKNQSKAGG